MDYLSLIKAPILTELSDFIELFNVSLSTGDGLLAQALEHIKSRSGKRMRPILILLIAKNFGRVNDATLNAAVGLELLHTASLVHDDVVDESNERRGQASVNATYDNKVAVLVGDYILSTALLRVAFTHSETIVQHLAELGRTLSNGEILQLSNIQRNTISEQTYYEVINQKTAALFEACAGIGALSVNADEERVGAAKKFGHNLGMIFQIRDDIFDYFSDDAIGKPTGNDMHEGKLTLPAIYALSSTGNEAMREIALKVKNNTASPDEIGNLVEFTKANGGIEYAEKKMLELRDEALAFVENYSKDDTIRKALVSYIDFVIQRNV